MKSPFANRQLIRRINYTLIKAFYEHFSPLFVGLADKNHRLDRSISASEHTFGVGFAFGFRNKNMHNGKEETVFNEALTCTGGDVIGCGLMVAQKTKSAANCEQCQQKQCTIFLTKNGQLWGFSFFTN